MTGRDIFVGLWFAALAFTLLARALTVYKIGNEDLRVVTAGIVRTIIAFDDITDLEVRWGFSDRFWQLSYYQLGFRKTMRIKKRGWTKYILLNPKNPKALIDTINAYRRARNQTPLSSNI